MHDALRCHAGRCYHPWRAPPRYAFGTSFVRLRTFSIAATKISWTLNVCRTNNFHTRCFSKKYILAKIMWKRWFFTSFTHSPPPHKKGERTSFRGKPFRVASSISLHHVSKEFFRWLIFLRLSVRWLDYMCRTLRTWEKASAYTIGLYK